MKKQWTLYLLGAYLLQTFVCTMPASADSPWEKAYKRQRSAANDARDMARERAKAREAFLDGDFDDAREHSRNAAKEEREFIRHTNEAHMYGGGYYY
ncbi:MAG: hypothetical protein K2W82_05365 [Candidatus Obscuribacterales bacterium]|nr:hypothetical protein [Candidatus Obscuribacterales bacterium]